MINARKESKIKYPSGTFLELDIWIPKLDISFEFQVKMNTKKRKHKSKERKEKYHQIQINSLSYYNVQDDYHYIPTWYIHVPLPQVQERDDILLFRFKFC